MKIKKNETIQVRDHINSTGTNILIGKQKTLCIDFTDLTNLYAYNQNSVITECCLRDDKVSALLIVTEPVSGTKVTCPVPCCLIKN